MWEYDPSLNRFGTTESLMLLPYFTNGCIDSMEGLLFESASTTPFHFINQNELSPEPLERGGRAPLRRSRRPARHPSTSNSSGSATS